MSILDHLSDTDYLTFEKVLNLQEGKLGIVVSFIAILELGKQQMIEIVQKNAYSPIKLKLI